MSGAGGRGSEMCGDFRGVWQVLADGVAHASKHLSPDLILDMATLTGAQVTPPQSAQVTPPLTGEMRRLAAPRCRLARRRRTRCATRRGRGSGLQPAGKGGGQRSPLMGARPAEPAGCGSGLLQARCRD